MVAAFIDLRANTLSPEDIASFIVEHDLYRRQKDDRHPEPWQIARRAEKYPVLFQRSGHWSSPIRLR